MVELEDDKEPKDAAWAPDGGYIPRIVFAKSDGAPQKDIVNAARAGGQYKYFYTDVRSVSAGMTAALAAMK